MTQHSETVGHSTYEKLKHDIIFGVLTPGRKLKLSGLREHYDASVSTLRETLNRLASEGFVAAEEQRGFFVAPVSTKDLVEITNLRVLMECHAIRLSVEKGGTEWEANLVAAHYKLHQMEKRMAEGDESKIETWKRFDWEFHLALIEACDSKNLLDLHAIVYDKYLRYQMLVLTYRGQPAVEEHRAMLEAALERDGERVAGLLETHIQNGLDHALAAMTSGA